LERRCLDHVISEYPKFVLATGGSLVSEPATFERLLAACFTVWLQAAPEDHMRRVLDQGDIRPMADNREAMEDLRRILQAREPLYRKADVVFDTSGQTVAELVSKLAAEVAK
jgi:XRE family aerobic/anaerobic benzoate catabolism transcriptional regulator